MINIEKIKNEMPKNNLVIINHNNEFNKIGTKLNDFILQESMGTYYKTNIIQTYSLHSIIFIILLVILTFTINKYYPIKKMFKKNVAKKSKEKPENLQQLSEENEENDSSKNNKAQQLF